MRVKEELRNYKRNPEDILQEKIMNMLTLKGWFVKSTHGNLYQKGLPDLFATHSKYGGRWIEVKVADSYCFTGAQLEDFPKICANGTGIWILVNDSEEEYQKLFKPYNWYQYMLLLNQRGCP